MDKLKIDGLMMKDIGIFISSTKLYLIAFYSYFMRREELSQMKMFSLNL